MTRVAHNKLTIDFMRGKFESIGYKLLTTEYHNNRQRLEFTCINEHQSTLAWAEFNGGARCVKCHYDTYRKDRKSSRDDIAMFLNTHGMILLSDYEVHNKPIEFMCDKGHKAISNLSNIKRAIKVGRNGCLICKHMLLGGQTNPNWNGGTTSINQSIRGSIEYKIFTRNVFVRDAFTCHVCRKRNVGQLRAHHLNSFADFPEMRLDESNAVTLCAKCHDEKYEGSFHQIFGKYHNTKEQFNKYLELRRSNLVQVQDNLCRL